MSATTIEGRHTAVRIAWRPAVALTLASVAGLTMVLWPLVFTPPEELSHNSDAPFVFVVIMPAVIAVVLAELRSGGMDTKSLAMLGVLSALGAALRPMGAGVGGFETVFFLLILAGRVYGPGFGFVLGTTTLFASALLTGGVGPWLPFQMLASAWVGLGAGLLPRARGRAEIAMLAGYGALSALVFGFLMNMWFWPYAIGEGTDLSYVAGDAVWSNLHRFVLYTIATSTFGWDIGRAITNVVVILVLGPTILATLRRATRRAAFGAPVTFGPVVAAADPGGSGVGEQAERDVGSVGHDPVDLPGGELRDAIRLVDGPHVDHEAGIATADHDGFVDEAVPGVQRTVAPLDRDGERVDRLDD